MEAQKPDPRPTLWEQVLRFGIRLLNAIFDARRDSFSRVFGRVWLAGLFLLGLYLWGIFYSWGNISLDFLDWAEVTGPRYALLKDAMTRGQIPLHAANLTALRGVTDRYFAIPDTPFPPEIFLLKYLSIGEYLFIDTVLLYSIGFIGLALLRRKYHLSPLAFLLLFLLFNFNGFITSHLAVGHSIYAAYFLIPFYVLLMLELLEREQASWKWLLGYSVLQLAILMEGFFHLYIWFMIFLAVLTVFNRRLLKPAATAGLFAVLVGLPRLLPPVLVLGRITHEFMGGPATVTDLISSLIVLRDPDRAMTLPSKIFPLSWWEQDYYIGLLGLALLVIFGVLIPLWRDRCDRSVHMQILIASLVFSVLSIGQVFSAVLRIAPIPPLTGERVSARFFVLPLVAIMVQAAIFLQRELDVRKIKPRDQILILGLVALLFHDLNQHVQAWRIRYLDGLVYLFPKVPFNPAQHTLAIRPDPVYVLLLAVGCAISLLVIGFLIFMTLRSGEREQSISEQSISE